MPDTDPSYFFFALWDYWRHDEYVPAFQCFDAAWEMMTWLKDNGMEVDCAQKVKRDWAIITVDEPPHLVDQSNPDEMMLVFDFFKALRPKEAYTSLWDLIFEMFYLFEGGPMFVYTNWNYYQIEPRFPYLYRGYEVDPLPGCWGY
ncbi:hypothetical protein KIPB_011322 [Kipferlia bialata]|uniref:Uncharacterized protein n=1 Tax=Kipferlia bialata TaxID=797122 RepID=A0A9K3GN90_9EUKA|nr:hypothetical protein KIPB_011322 [Kipferlia bialata]|eukprot:g11322.t1